MNSHSLIMKTYHAARPSHEPTSCNSPRGWSGAENAGEPTGPPRVTGEDRAQVLGSEPAGENLAEQIAEVGGQGQVAPLVELAGSEAGPAAVDLSALHGAAEDEGDARVAMVGPAVAVLAHRAPELRHGHHHHVGHAVAQVAVERADRPGELAQPVRELSLHPALGRVVVPAAHVTERHLHPHVRLDELRHLAQAVAVAAALVDHPGCGLVPGRIGLLQQLADLERLA